jgi:photosystem II stability/assembly factor-like uncharacterized protein
MIRVSSRLFAFVGFAIPSRAAMVALLLALGSNPGLAQTTPFQYRSAGMVHDSFTFDGNEVWTVEDGGRIRHRTSAGVWEFQIVPSPIKTMLRHIHFVPDDTPADGPTGWAVGDEGWIIKTTNGGTTWVQTNFDSTHAQVPAVLLPQYQRQYAPDTEQLYDVFFLDEMRGWLCGLHGIWKTLDGAVVVNAFETAFM